MSGGWYKQQRNIPERAWFKDADVLQLYTYLKATAYVADGKYEGHIVRRGSCPTTRPDMMEATGLTYKKVDRCLKCLIANGDIFVKGYSKFSIVTICDYDACGPNDTLFEDSEVRQRYDKVHDKGTTKGTTPHLLLKEERREEDYLISNFIPYKKEREKGDVVLEIKNRYNKEFSDILPPCLRLSTATRIAIEDCLHRFGLQSVDMVFQQIKTEKFHLGDNKTGFIANLSFIFTPKNYQQYLERAHLARRKKGPQQKEDAPSVEAEPQLTKEEKEKLRVQNRCKTLRFFVEELKNLDHKPAWYGTLLDAYKSGELAAYGIDWEPQPHVFENICC